MIHLFRTFLFALIGTAILVPAHAQVAVELVPFKRRIYLRYEPILATVKITNLSGRDLMLHDAEQPWFGFDVTGSNTETLVPPRNLDYKLDPLEIKIGETVKRTVNLTQLYGVTEFGTHRVKATVYVKDLNKLFASKTSVIEISEGIPVWRQTVGVPDTLPNAGRNHTIKLIEFQREKRYLYARIEDEEQGIVYGTYQIGHMIDGTTPQIQLDTTNNLYVLLLVGPKTYTLTNISVNGQFLGQSVYNAPKSKPALRRLADGTIQIVGAHRDTTANTASGNGTPAGPAPVKLSERPPGMPAN
jgi:hypothetical protein